MRSTQVQALIENGQLWENVARTPGPLPHKGYKALTPPVDNDTPAILIVLIRDKFIPTLQLYIATNSFTLQLYIAPSPFEFQGPLGQTPCRARSGVL